MKVKTLRSNVLQQSSISFSGSQPEATLDTNGGIANQPILRAAEEAALGLLEPPSERVRDIFS
jgi:hypothetical protein